MHEGLQDGNKCPTCGGYIPRRHEGKVYAGAFILDGKRVVIRSKPSDGYKDPIILDERTQWFDDGIYKLSPGQRYFRRWTKTLHREVWIRAFGKIPDKHHIHHKDRDPHNNNLWNIELLPIAEHFSLSKPNAKGFSAKAREAAGKWHRSKEGREWHSRHSIESRSWERWKREEIPCAFCGKPFKALIRSGPSPGIYCHANCKSAARRERMRADRML